MAEYFLISQLPSLDGISENTPLPITEERFLELCGRFLDEKVLNEIKSLTLVPSRQTVSSNSPLIEAWNNGERALRLALGKVRGEKMGKPFDLQNQNLTQELLKVANTAVEIGNPLEAENFLLNYRLSFLEMLRPTDSFSEEYLIYYALKLKLIIRIRQFDKDLGETTYKDNYDSILNKDRLEV